MTNSSVDRWMGHLKREIETLENCNVEGKDRMALWADISRMIRGLHGTAIGWSNWIANVEYRDRFPKKDVIMFWNLLKEPTIALLKADIKATMKGLKRKKEEDEAKKVIPPRGIIV